jgi:hypothetical protein
VEEDVLPAKRLFPVSVDRAEILIEPRFRTLLSSRLFDLRRRSWPAAWSTRSS